MRKPAQVQRFIAALLIGCQLLSANPAVADHVLARAARLVGEATYDGKEPQLGGDNCVEELAQNIDWLEHHIDTYGSVVAKTPDIWGQARLTKHRDEYERILYRELTNFDVKINAAISQSDSSFLSQALALSAAVSGASGAGGAAAASSSSTTTTAPPTPTPILAPPGLPTPQAATAAAFTPVNSLDNFTAYKSGGIALEPTIELDQLARYLQHLHELRRINEGDDTSDSPGYSLNLVRIPVSILPGKLTRTGFGAEITVTATPVLSDDLMPTTFHNLAVNDMVDLLGLPLVRVTEALNPLESDAARNLLTDTQAKIELSYQGGATTAEKMKDAIRPDISRAWKNEKVVDALRKAIKDAEIPAKDPNDPPTETCLELMDGPKAADTVSPERRMNAHARARLERSAAEVAPTYRSRALEIRVNEAQREQADAAKRQQELNHLRDEYHKGTQDFQQNFQALRQFGAPQTELNELQTAVNKGGNDKVVNDAIQKALNSAKQDAATKPKIDKNVAELLRQLDLAANRNDPSLASCSIAKLYVLYKDKNGLKELQNILDNANAILTNDAGGQHPWAAASVIPSGRSRRALEPLSPTQIVEVMGIRNLTTVASFFNDAYYGRAIRWNGAGSNCTPKGDKQLETRVDLLDAQKFLQEELESAYHLLCQPEHIHLFASFAAPCSELAEQIHGGHLTEGSPHLQSVVAMRHNFFRQLHSGMVREASAGAEPDEEEISEAANTVEFLAWSLVVESALLNDRLNLDVRKIAQAKQVPDLNTTRDYNFFLPEIASAPKPGTEDLVSEFQQATQVFKRYVEVRWPMHVFAIDPREQDQNVADASARRRELQFALALGFANGQIGVNSLTKYSRTLETEVETITLNRTIVGFGHGDDTFGWRFQPRVQALPIPGTFGTIRETLCGTPRDYDLRHRQLEPGQRECVAIVLMPSFVPYADFDIRSNWYALTNPKNAALTMKDTVHLSRAITAMRNSQEKCSKCSCLYRDNEVGRLYKRIDQLDRELPLQTQRALVPYENTLGGFEMFNTGVTDLGPQLVGWYGAPGIRVGADALNSFGCGNTAIPAAGGRSPIAGPLMYTDSSGKAVSAMVKDQYGNAVPLIVPNELPICEGAGTTVFLVGKKFSVHDTKVIAGGVCIPSVQLVSRSIMRVTIPSCVQTVSICENNTNNEYVAVYLATPYGVTNHLHIPVQRDLSKAVQDQIKQAVADDLKALNVSGPPISIAAVDSNNKTAYADVGCDSSGASPNCTNLVGAVKLNPKLQYITKNDPRLANQQLVIKAAPLFKEGFRSGLTDIGMFAQMPAAQSFDAAGGDVLLPGHTRSPKVELLEAITKNLKLSDFSGGKVTLKLVYFAQVDADVPIQLMDQFDLVVTLTGAPANANGAPDAVASAAPNATGVVATVTPANGASTSPSAVATPPQGTQVQPSSSGGSATSTSGAELIPAPQNSASPSGGGATKSGCGCTLNERPTDVQLISGAQSTQTVPPSGAWPAEPQVLPTNNASPIPEIRFRSPQGETTPAGQAPVNRRQAAAPSASMPTGNGQQYPVQLAQFIPSEATTRLPSVEELPALKENAAGQIAEINNRLQQLGQQQAAIQAALVSPPAPSAATAGQSVVNVNIQQPHKLSLLEEIQMPCFHRAFVKVRESWRNVRDELPCN